MILRSLVLTILVALVILLSGCGAFSPPEPPSRAEVAVKIVVAGEEIKAGAEKEGFAIGEHGEISAK